MEKVNALIRQSALEEDEYTKPFEPNEPYDYPGDLFD